MNTLSFINSYMSKLYNHDIPYSIIPAKIEVSLNKSVASKISITRKMNKNMEIIKKFVDTVQLFSAKVRKMFSITSEWLEETKEANNMNISMIENPVYLKIWKSLIEAESWRSNYHLKLILEKFNMDIKVNC